MSIQVLVDEGLRGQNWLDHGNDRIPTGIVSEPAKRWAKSSQDPGGSATLSVTDCYLC